jgi:hypothetical protein
MQYNIVKALTKKGNTPYKVSEFECEFLSTARNTFIQKAIVNKYKKIPTIEIGTKNIPFFLNQVVFIYKGFNYKFAKYSH